MIPKRVRLQGFLCYKESQEVSFEDGSLWLLAGLNGSGKSSIFDAVTFALFGHHRGGGQQAAELINKDSSGLVVEFDFALDQQLYRAKRTVRHGQRSASATQQIYRWHADENNGTGRWEPVPDTKGRNEFKAWVDEHIGLSYDTFTSSVLLLQGNAEKLLNSGPKDRHAVLAGIVDLQRYEALHQRADGERKSLLTIRENLQTQLDSLPAVTDSELAEAEERIAGAETIRSQAQAEVERLQTLEFQAREWGLLQGRLANVCRRWDEAQKLLADAAAIERALERLAQLRQVLPHMETIQQQRQQIGESETRTRELIARQQKLTERLAGQSSSLEQTRQKWTIQQNRIATDDVKHREVTALLRQAATQLEKLKEYERQESDLKRLQADLARLPANPAETLAQLRRQHEDLAALVPVVAQLGRLQAQREQLRTAQARARTALQAQQAIQARGEQLGTEITALQPRVEEANRVRQQADEQAAEVRALLQQATQDQKQFRELEGARVCRQCGQPLTPGHFAEELRRRDKEVKNLNGRFQKAGAAQQAARQAAQELQQQLDQLEKTRQTAREEFRDRRAEAEQSRQEMERLRTECAAVYTELPEAFRLRVSPVLPEDWLTTAYPTREDLEALRRQTADLAAVRQQLRGAEQVQQQWTTLKAQEADKRQSLARLQADLPAQRQTVRQEHVRLEDEDRSLAESLAARRKEAAEAQKQIDRLTREREQTQQQLTEVGGKLGNEETTRRLCQQASNRAQKELPESWKVQVEGLGLAALNRWRQERDDLVRERTEERGQQLQQARLNLAVIGQDKAELEEQTEQFPAEARQEPAQVQVQLQAARQVQRTRDDELSLARQKKKELETRRQKRQEVQEQFDETEREHARADTLAELLGRDRLQMHLLRQAERQVVDHANAVLDRLSGGQLLLRLSGEAGGEDSTAKALELEAYNRTTGEKPINVAFLSGSQKFRVAVSLALGIGQYASRRHRPIEAVIIDEGFGCLDRQGRQVMIQELNNLRGQLRCILLVSHQEEFVDAFPDRYHFELTDGTTRVTRFQR